MTKAEAYAAAIEADKAFHAALVAFYGKRRAGDARYYMDHDAHAVDVIRTKGEYLRAAENLRKAS